MASLKTHKRKNHTLTYCGLPFWVPLGEPDEVTCKKCRKSLEKESLLSKKVSNANLFQSKGSR